MNKRTTYDLNPWQRRDVPFYGDIRDKLGSLNQANREIDKVISQYFSQTLLDCTSLDYTHSFESARYLMIHVLGSRWRVFTLSEWVEKALRAKGAWTIHIKPDYALNQLFTKEGRCIHAATPAIALCYAIFDALLWVDPISTDNSGQA